MSVVSLPRKTREQCNRFPATQDLMETLSRFIFAVAAGIGNHLRWAQARPSGPLPVASSPLVSSFFKSTATTLSLALTAM